MSRLLALLALLAAPLGAATYNVGPGQTYTTIGAVPWATLAAGDVVRIHYRATPYAEKWVLCRQGAAGNPITIQGVPEAGTGALPVITGSGAVTAAGLNYWGENRGVLKIGGASTPADLMPQYIVVEHLEFRSAHPSYTFTDDGGNPGVAYAQNAAGIYVEKGKHITIRNCTLTDCGNGLFVGPGGVAGGTGNPALTEDIYVGHCYIHGNGISASAYEHNSYCESDGILYEFNRYGPLRSGASGNNLKDRSARCVVRFNWIESGNRQLDLVEADGSGIETLPGYDSTFVYGNVLIEPDAAGNSQIIHYGGDNGTTSTYRKGTLYLYNNTIYSTRSGNTTLVRLSTNSETCDCRNNIVFVTANASNLGLIDDSGVLNYRNCFFKGAPTPSHSGAGMTGTVTNQGGVVTGADPGWTNVGGQDFTLTTGAACRDTGTTPHSATQPTYPVGSEYVKHQQSRGRATDATMDIGAFEYGSGTATSAPAAPTGCTATALSGLQIQVTWTDASNNEDGFQLERKIGSGSFSLLVSLGAGVTSHTDTGLAAGETYTYRVRATNTVGNSTYSNEASAVAAVTVGGGSGGGSSGGGGGGGGCSAGLESGLGLLVLLLLGTGLACSRQCPRTDCPTQ